MVRYHIIVETDSSVDKEKNSGRIEESFQTESSGFGVKYCSWSSAAKSVGDIFLPVENWERDSSLGGQKEKERRFSEVASKVSEGRISRPGEGRLRATSLSQQQLVTGESAGNANPASGISLGPGNFLSRRRRSTLSGEARPVDPAIHIARTRKDQSGPKPGSKEYYSIHTSRDYRFGRVEIQGFDNEMASASVTSTTVAEVAQVAQVAGSSSVNDDLVPVPEAKTTATLKSTFMGYGVVRLYREQDEGEEETADTDDATVVAILAVPGYMSTGDLLEYLGEDTRKRSSHIRLVTSNGVPNRYMVLIKFLDAKFATDFYLNYNGKVFNSMEAETCHVVYVKSVQFRSPPRRGDGDEIPYLIKDPFTGIGIGAETDDKTATESSATAVSSSLVSNSASTSSAIQHNKLSSLQELPTCPVCLERMDATITGLLTILCQHTFHCQCLQKWGDSSCPVCRHTNADSYGTYEQADSSSALPALSSKCYVCEAGSNLWACLICGHVGCGRYDKAHAYDHYVATGHCFSMDITTQRVWDYSSDGYVHRLIQNQSDGKLVELPSGSSSTADGKKDIENDLSLQYTYLLTSQLESQREYYESLLAEAEGALLQYRTLDDRIDRIKQENEAKFQTDHARLLEKVKTISESVTQANRQIEEEKAFSLGLVTKVDSLVETIKQKDQEINDLNDQIRDLMFFLDAKEKLANADEDVQQGTVSVAPAPSKKKPKRKPKK
ncbi:Etp1p [Sugiyamaella lignohabitans]|uniref:Etp1p n=1 Tax=Sugiyamaella lignohabitans TaxID=796027 RepID=A0A167CUF1_9ASCO|nr:Etp1p [Sugiyamaella lignohabitans]ANB12116.1 Etp1p [Sugiyamaella lignohabitans]